MSAITTEDIHIDTDQGRLFARRWALGPDDAAHHAPIVLFHDSLGCVDLWRDFPERLAITTQRTVIAYDRLGFGRSDPHPGTLALTFIHDEANGGFRRLRDALGFNDFIAFGHSVGGGMATSCAAAYGDVCRGLVTESAQTFVEDRTRAGVLQAKHGFAQPGQVDRLKKYHGDKAAWVLSAWVDTWLSPEFADWKLDDELRRVRCPVLALHGDQDEYGSAAHPEKIAALTGGRAVVLEGCGHVPHREKLDAVLGLAGQWLTNIGLSSAGVTPYMP